MNKNISLRIKIIYGIKEYKVNSQHNNYLRQIKILYGRGDINI